MSKIIEIDDELYEYLTNEIKKYELIKKSNDTSISKLSYSNIIRKKLNFFNQPIGKKGTKKPARSIKKQIQITVVEIVLAFERIYPHTTLEQLDLYMMTSNPNPIVDSVLDYLVDNNYLIRSAPISNSKIGTTPVHKKLKPIKEEDKELILTYHWKTERSPRYYLEDIEKDIPLIQKYHVKKNTYN